MRNGCSEFDVPQTFPTNFRLDHFHAALFTNDASVLHAFVFAAIALIILNGPENFSAEQTIALWLECTIIDGLWLFNFAIRPGPDFLRTR